MAEYEIRYVHGHVEVYARGSFLFSADSVGEAIDELGA